MDISNAKWTYVMENRGLHVENLRFLWTFLMETTPKSLQMSIAHYKCPLAHRQKVDISNFIVDKCNCFMDNHTASSVQSIKDVHKNG